MAVSYVKSIVQADDTTSLNTQSFTASASNAGDAIVVLVACGVTGTPLTVTLTATGWTFTQLGGINTGVVSGSTNVFSALFVAIAPNTSSTTFTVTWQNVGGFIEHTALGDEFTGNDQTGGLATFDNFGSSFSAGSGNPSIDIVPFNNNDAVWMGTVDGASSAGTIGGNTATKGSDDGSGDITQYFVLSGGAGTKVTCSITGSNTGFLAHACTIAPPVGSIDGLRVDNWCKGYASAIVASVQTNALTTAGPNELLVAFSGYDDQSNVGDVTVTGGGLTWHKLTSANSTTTGGGMKGCACVSWAYASSKLTAQQFTGTFGTSNPGWLVVVAFIGASSSGIGATAVAGSTTGTPTKSLTTTAANSWVWGCAWDWTSNVVPVPGSGQIVYDSFDDIGNGDSGWVQLQALQTASSGTSVTINNTTPSGDNWALNVVEILSGAQFTTCTWLGSAAIV